MSPLVANGGTVRSSCAHGVGMKVRFTVRGNRDEWRVGLGADECTRSGAPARSWSLWARTGHAALRQAPSMPAESYRRSRPNPAGRPSRCRFAEADTRRGRSMRFWVERKAGAYLPRKDDIVFAEIRGRRTDRRAQMPMVRAPKSATSLTRQEPISGYEPELPRIPDQRSSGSRRSEAGYFLVERW
ncbi:hypothetical protein SAMN05877809_103162 [Rhodobacter sp. JA431]|nr:hypothetical protein SAMN05877809_103162 [Rhodobacter sp. JA431]